MRGGRKVEIAKIEWQIMQALRDACAFTYLFYSGSYHIGDNEHIFVVGAAGTII